MGYFYDDPHEHPDTHKIEVAGKEVPWLVTKRAIEKGKERGIDLDALEKLEDEEVGASDAIDAVVDMLVLGRIPFQEKGHEHPNREDFEEVIAISGVEDLVYKINGALTGLSDEQLEELMGKGNRGQETRSTSTQKSGSDSDIDKG